MLNWIKNKWPLCRHFVLLDRNCPYCTDKENDKDDRYTTDPTDSRLGHGIDTKPLEQQKTYLILSKEEIAKGFTRPLRDKYIHSKCGIETVMSLTISETYARNPKFYGATYCVGCRMHKPVGEFKWSEDNKTVGS